MEYKANKTRISVTIIVSIVALAWMFYYCPKSKSDSAKVSINKSQPIKPKIVKFKNCEITAINDTLDPTVKEVQINIGSGRIIVKTSNTRSLKVGKPVKVSKVEKYFNGISTKDFYYIEAVGLIRDEKTVTVKKWRLNTSLFSKIITFRDEGRENTITVPKEYKIKNGDSIRVTKILWENTPGDNYIDYQLTDRFLF